MERSTVRITRLTFPVLVACAVLAPLAIHWLAGRTLVWFDTLRLYAPQRWLVDEALRTFRLPLWNPFMGGGVPLLADAIHGVLHPVSIFTAWLGTDRSADLLIGGYVACAGLGAALLARDLGASRSGAAGAAFAYGMSGFVLSMAGNLVFLAGAGSLPFCVVGVRRFVADPRAATLAFGVLGAAILALSGDVQSFMVGAGLALALAWEVCGWRGAARAAAAAAVGLLVAGVQIVPSAVHVSRTVRNVEIWAPTPAIWAFEPWRLPELVLPGLFWGPDPYADRVFGAFADPGSYPTSGFPLPFAASVFVGLLPMALAIAGVREGRRGRVLGALALVLLWVALGPRLGASAVLEHVPIWRAFRYSEKLVGPMTLVVAALAALGFDAVVERRLAGRHVLAIVAVLGLGAIVVCYLEASRLAPAVAPLAKARVVRGAWHVIAGAAAMGAWVVVRDRVGGVAGRVALAVLAWAGMAAAAPAALRAGDPAARLRAPGPDLHADAPGPRIFTPHLQDMIVGAPGPRSIDLWAREQALQGFPAYNVRSRLDSLNAYCAMEPERLELLFADAWAHWPLAPRRYAVTHVLLDPPLDEAERNLYAASIREATFVSASGGHEVWAVPHRPWASFPEKLRSVPDAQEALSEAGQVFMEESPTVVVEAFSPFTGGPGRAISIERGLESLRVEAEADRDATLVIADAWWPGWEATVDGVPVSIFRADLLVRAVRWPAGRHVLEMRYRPSEVRTGLFVSVLGIAALTVWIAVLRRTRTRRRSPDGLHQGGASRCVATREHATNGRRAALASRRAARDDGART